jgi:hypothetical protein
MKFIRHFAVVVCVVAIIVAAAVLWSHTSGGGNAGPQVPPQQVVRRIAEVKAGQLRIGPDTGLHLADTQNLIRTCIIEGALAAVVITISVIRRQQRRSRHA